MGARALGKGWGSFPEAREPYEYLPFPRVSSASPLLHCYLMDMGIGVGPKGLNTHPCPSPV